MNPNSLAAALHRISSDRRRAFVHQKMARAWIALAAGLILYLLGARLFAWEAPFFIPAIIALGIVTWLFVRASANRLEFSMLDIAREVEAGDARLNSLLLAAYEEQQNAGTEGLSYLQERVIVEALEANRRSPWGQQYAERRFFKTLSHAGGLAVFVVALVLSVGLGPRGKILTALLGGVTVTPGTSEIERGSALAIMAKFPEPAPPEVRVLVTPKSGPVRSLPMDRALADPTFGASFPEVQEDFSYQVEYKGKKTAEYKISVFDFPNLRKADARLTYPKFTGLTDKQIDDTHRVSAVEGTVVDYRLELNKPVKKATLVSKAGENYPLIRDEKFPNVYHVKIPLNESVKLALALKDDAGRTNKAPHEFAFEAMPNKAPDLKIVHPRGDQRVSALEEVALQAEARDDFGMGSYGLAYSLGGGDPKFIKVGDQASANEKKALAHLLRIEELNAEPDQLISYFAWAEDRGPDGKLRRNESDMYFAEIRPFEEIFRKGNGGDQQQQQQQQGGEQGGQPAPGEQLAELQKEIINATWKLQRTENKPKPSANFKKDVTTVRDSQQKALGQAETMLEKINDPKTKAMAESAVAEMRKAKDHLSESVTRTTPEALPQALSAERAAYQALLRLQAREYRVNRQRQQGGGGGGGAQQRAQRQLDELDVEEEKNRYETQSQAAAQKSPEQTEQLQTLNRLKELARRQNDVNEKLKELQASLQEAKTEAEKEELRRRLKRLREEQQDLVQDMDELNQKMAQSPQQSENADARQQLDQARSEAQKASQQMDEKSMGQAASAGARSEKDLKKLTDDYRKATSQQFSEEMRDMRREARELAEKEKEIADKMEALKNPKQRTLSDVGGKDELARQLTQQKTNYANIVERMKKVTEQAETPEPLLAEKLYDTVRQLNQTDTEKTLDQASELLRRSFVPQASQLEEKARKNIDRLRAGINEAATRLLGDEADALRAASRELDDLARRVQNEVTSLRSTNFAGASGPRGTNGLPVAATGPEGTNGLAGASGPTGTNQVGRARAGQNGERQVAQAPGQNGEPGEQPNGQPSDQNGERQNGQRGQRGQRGQQPGQQQLGEPRDPGERGQAGQQGQGQQGQGGQQAGQGGGGARQNFYDQVARENQNRRNGGGSGPTSNERGPITGDNFREWADQLRNVQEMIDAQDLRNDLTGVLDRAREMRSEYVRHSVQPRQNLLEDHVLKPLVEVRQRVAEELARREAGSVAPLDRDPVPGRYAELVSRYYQSLGQGAPPQKVAEKPAK